MAVLSNLLAIGDLKMKMKKLLAASVAAALTLSAFNVSADEKDDQFKEDHPNKAKIMVKAKIKDACYLGSVPMLDFGKLFPGWMDAGFKHMIDGDLTFKCTKGTHYTLSFDQGKNAEGQYRYMNMKMISLMLYLVIIKIL